MDGGLSPSPSGLRAEGGKRPDPFANEKPRLIIRFHDLAAHADKLTEGTKELLRRYPTMRVDVYPTHRTVSFPSWIADDTRKNATGARTTNGGEGIENVLPGLPFPMPKTGYEVMWNHLLNYRGLGIDTTYDSWNVGANGRAVLASSARAIYAWPVHDRKQDRLVSEAEPFWYIKVAYRAPARRNGETTLVWDSVNPLKQPRRAWQYVPGQRRVKLAPEIAYDTPNPGSAGASTYDDVLIFNGAMDRFDFRLVGKKEMYVPYSNYKLTYFAQPADVTTPAHINPDFVRWELHRVWVVEARLKEGKGHVYSRRVFYVDEDSWAALAADEYDANGRLYRSSFAHQTFSYDAQAQFNDTVGYYDFNLGMYNITFLTGPYAGVRHLTDMPEKTFWSPEALAGAGIR